MGMNVFSLIAPYVGLSILV